MVNAIENQKIKRTDPATILLISPYLQKLARLLFCTYLETHPDQVILPHGVAISPISYRTTLIFSHQPILLPGELFLSIELIESKIY
ncbi:hypothetical protein [Okeania sp.]|uniref:hypothetical protein n=1 Tax=Okeania sp. TaxID=3100323 RepID=UPI002B4AF4F5|nr:hypothetical protein [Okeania sp.]